MIDPSSYAPSSESLAGRVILITGSGDGIGKALALKCASLKATVILHGRNVRKLEKAHDEIVAAGGLHPSLLPLDFEKAGPAEYEAMADALRKQFGRLDGLVHNAAMLGDRSPIEHHDVSKWMRTLHVNLNAPFLMTRYCFPLLKASPDASVLFTSSGGVRHPRAYWGAYLVSKWAGEGLMHMLADELESSPALRVNSINPGKVRTNLRLQAYPGEDRSQLAEASSILSTYLYLLGPDSRGVSGKSFDCQPPYIPA